LFPHILQALKLLINDARGSLRSPVILIILYGVDTDVKNDIPDGTQAGIEKS
jgi:hypothetical protein